MGGDPEECREHAKQCLVLAAQSSPPLRRGSNSSLKYEARLAADIERSNSLLQRWRW